MKRSLRKRNFLKRLCRISIIIMEEAAMMKVEMTVEIVIMMMKVTIMKTIRMMGAIMKTILKMLKL